SLLRAVTDGDVNLVRALLAQGTDANVRNAAGQTPLMLAAGFAHEDVVSVLLKAGASLELQDDLGLTAVEWASNAPGVIRLFRDADENQVVAPSEPETPSHTVVDYNQTRDLSEFSQPAPVTQVFDRQETRTSGLGGLAGAILRDRAGRGSTSQHSNGGER